MNHRLLIVSPRDTAMPPTAPAPKIEISVHNATAPGRRPDVAVTGCPISISRIMQGGYFNPAGAHSVDAMRSRWTTRSLFFLVLCCFVVFRCFVAVCLGVVLLLF